MTTSPQPPAPPAARGVGRANIALLVVGAICALIGMAATAGGGALVWAHATQRDAAGYYTAPTTRFTTETAAVTADVDLGEAPGQRDWTIAHPIGTVRLRATSAMEGQLFIGIGPSDAVDRWLAGVAHERVSGPNFGPLRSTSTIEPGDREAEPPGEQTFWAASAQGSDTQTLRWPSESGRWTAVAMNADGTPGIDVRVSVGARTGALLPIGIGLAAVGVVLLVAAAMFMFFGLRDHAARPAPNRPSVPGSYPVRLTGHLDPPLSRWLWLVKWFLLIPHAVVLLLLWVAVSVLTVYAGIVILFTGRYPRSVFDFNVGVMRWTWRVSFYGLSAFGTDRYPPFSLNPEPGDTAQLEIDYPDRLSRGLVLVKWWLLAIPHYLVVAVFAGGWGLGWDGARIASGGGLIALLSIVAVVVLAARGTYPVSIFDFVMGMNRWCYRVLAYSALMRDEYPPFRLDTGGTDPGTVAELTPPAPRPPADVDLSGPTPYGPSPQPASVPTVGQPMNEVSG